MAEKNETNERNERWEIFKHQVLQWKNAHDDEYFDFAEKMDNATGKGFIAMARFLNKQLPELMAAWQRRWRNDAPDDNMDELDDIVLKSDILKEWIGDVEANDTNTTNGSKNLGALTLCWIIYGQMFETVIRQYERFRLSKRVGYLQKHVIIPMLIKRAIRASVKNGYRTQHDWDMYFKLAKAYKEDAAVAETVWEEMKAEITDAKELAVMEEANYALQKSHSTTGREPAKSKPLNDYLTCEDEEVKQAVISVIREHIKQNKSGVSIALTFVALKELGIITGINYDVEYYYALSLQFKDFKELRSESSCKHALGDVQKTKWIYKDGRQCKGRLHEDDKYAPLYNMLLQKLRSAMESKTDKLP